MANYKTGAQRHNDRMDKIFKKSEELGHHTLHGSTEGKKKVMAKKLEARSKKAGFYVHGHKNYGDVYEK